MWTWLRSQWDALRGTFWFIPLLMVVSTFLLSLITLSLDRFAAQKGIDLKITVDWTFTRGPEGSRAVLSTIAGSMMTIASVCFSITVLALQQASSQFGPRLLHNFMKDLGNQIVLGTFISAFTFCLLVLRTINGTENEQFVPHLSVTTGLLFAMAGVGVFIYFLHHSAVSIQAEHVIAAVSRELDYAIDRLFPMKLGEEREEDESDSPLPAGFANESLPILSSTSSYLIAIDGETLIRQASKHDLVIELNYRPGHFVIEGCPLLRVWPSEHVNEEMAADLRRNFIFANRRTLLQDVEFAIDQLVEVAVRALSPGVNDPFTAVMCVDRLGAALVQFAQRSFPSEFRRDEAGKLRVVARGSTATSVVDAVFDQVRQAAIDNAAVSIRLLETIATIASFARTPSFQMAIRRQADTIYASSRERLQTERDRAALDDRYQKLTELFKENPCRE